MDKDSAIGPSPVTDSKTNDEDDDESLAASSVYDLPPGEIYDSTCVSDGLGSYCQSFLFCVFHEIPSVILIQMFGHRKLSFCDFFALQCAFTLQLAFLGLDKKPLSKIKYF